MPAMDNAVEEQVFFIIGKAVQYLQRGGAFGKECIVSRLGNRDEVVCQAVCLATRALFRKGACNKGCVAIVEATAIHKGRGVTD